MACGVFDCGGIVYAWSKCLSSSTIDRQAAISYNSDSCRIYVNRQILLSQTQEGLEFVGLC